MKGEGLGVRRLLSEEEVIVVGFPLQAGAAVGMAEERRAFSVDADFPFLGSGVEIHRGSALDLAGAEIAQGNGVGPQGADAAVSYH
jgi:hypothetical protein